MDRVAVGIICGVVLLVGLVLWGAGWAAMQSEKNWAAFVDANDCRIVERVESRSTAVTGFSSSGKMVVGTGVTPGQTVYECSDGVRYTR